MCFFLSFISEEETSAATAHQSDELLLPINVVKATHDVMSNSAHKQCGELKGTVTRPNNLKSIVL